MSWKIWLSFAEWPLDSVYDKPRNLVTCCHVRCYTNLCFQLECKHGPEVFKAFLSFTMVQCHRFYNLVLLPKIREDIAEHKKLNFHYYQALKKALFKPSAFMKGILLPLCQVPLSTSNIFKFLVLIVLQSYSCTLREAAILSSIIMKKSIPVLHSSAALLKIAELDYHPANVFFMK